MTIAQKLAQFQSVDLNTEIPKIIERTGQRVISLNKEQLYNKSIDKNNMPLLLYRSLGYALDKNKRNPSPGYGRPDLYDTGAFQRGFNITVNNDIFEVNSSDSKTPELTSKYGADIFGLTPENKGKYAVETVRPAISEYLRSKGVL